MKNASLTTGQRRIRARLTRQPITLCISKEIANGPTVELQVLNGNILQKSVVVHAQTGRDVIYNDYGFEFGEQVMPKEHAQRACPKAG